MSAKRRDIERLSERCWCAVAATACVVTGTEVEIPAFVPAGEPTVESRFGDEFPVLEHLDSAIGLARRAGHEDIAEALRHVEGSLQWSQNPSYDETNCDPSLLAGYAYAALSGPDGPIVCAAPRGGFYLMGPNVVYPDHNHRPREVYLVLTPGAQWRLDRGEWFDVLPGDLIYHDAWRWHAMRSSGRPLLAFAGWIEPGDRSAVRFAE